MLGSLLLLDAISVFTLPNATWVYKDRASVFATAEPLVNTNLTTFPFPPSDDKYLIKAKKSWRGILGLNSFDLGDGKFVVSLPKGKLFPTGNISIPLVRAPRLLLPSASKDCNVRPLGKVEVLDTETKKRLQEAISEKDFEDYLKKITGETPVSIEDEPYTIKTRFSPSKGHEMYNLYVHELIREYDLCDEVYYQHVPKVKSYNLICTRKGKKLQDEIVIVGGHSDSISERSEQWAPGAIDNGSGAVLTLLIALATRHHQFDRTVEFVWWTGEEQGLHGSIVHSNAKCDAQDDVKAVLTYDMIAFTEKNHFSIVEGTPKAHVQDVMENAFGNYKLYAKNFPECTQDPPKLSDDSFGSDHVPYQKLGYPSILTIDYDWEEVPAHTTLDRVNLANYEHARDSTRIALGSLYDYATFQSRN